MMVGSYMDESFDRKQAGVFSVGGILARGIPLFDLDRRWEQLRKRPDIGIKYFKASECQSGKGEFAKFVADPNNITPKERTILDSISHEFLDLIAHPVPFDDDAHLCVQGVGVVQSEFYDVIRDPNAKAILGNSPYRLAYDLAMIQCAWAMKELGGGEEGWEVSFICDEDAEHSPMAAEAFRNLRSTNPNASKYMATFSSVDDKKCEPLQAADAAIFEIRRAFNLSLGLWNGELRKQFNVLADAHAMFLMTHTKKEQLLHIVANHKPGEPFKLDTIMEMHLDEDIKISL
jgi:hypothetical protein